MSQYFGGTSAYALSLAPWALVVALMLGACSSIDGSRQNAEFGLDVMNESVTLVQGDRVAVAVRVERRNGFAAPVRLELAEGPAGVTALATEVSGGEGHMTLLAADEAGLETTEVVIRGASGGLKASDSLSLTVAPPGLSAEGLTLEEVASGLTIPWDLQFAPDGRLYFTERPGRVSVLTPEGEIAPIPFSAPPDFFPESEAGLMGMTFDPGFPETPYLYLCYSFREDGSPRSKISRFTLQEGELSSEADLLVIPDAGQHNGCRLAFGPQGFLYATMGDLGQDSGAQVESSLAGKIFRLKPDPGDPIPADNPFGPGNPVWTLGHRNPQGLAFDPASGLLYSTEHGPDRDDELNLIERGHNYGWPQVTGSRARDGFTPALKSYHPDSTIAISDLVFYRGEMFPAWQNDILFAGLKTGRLYHLTLSLDGKAVAEDEIVLARNDAFPTDALLEHEYGRLRSVAVAPDGSIYLSTSNGEGLDKILRLSRQ